MKRLIGLGLILMALPLSCRTAKVQYTPHTSVRDADLQIIGANECRLEGERIVLEFPNHNNCTSRIWDYQRKVCASHIPEINCKTFAEIESNIGPITSNISVITAAKNKKAKILACGQRDTTQFNDFVVQVVYPPDNKPNFTQTDCQKGVNFRVETICFRLCKTQACKNGVLTGSDADKLVLDCLQP